MTAILYSKLFFSCIAKLAQINRVKHMIDIETLEVKQPFYMLSVDVCIVQPCGPTRPLQKIITLPCKIIKRM